VAWIRVDLISLTLGTTTVFPWATFPVHGGRPKLSATAYDAAGHVLGQSQLGRPEF